MHIAQFDRTRPGLSLDIAVSDLFGIDVAEPVSTEKLPCNPVA